MAKISVRTVPRQNPSRLVDLIRAHLKHEFGKRRSPNDLFVDVKKIGDWWYGDRGAHAFEMAEKAIEEVWHQPPLYVREGGTMPITAFLEDLLKAPALHLPLGQSTDNAHLPNERIRYLNLTNGKEIIKSILRQVGESGRARVGNGGSSVLKEGQVQGNGHGEAHSSLHTEKMGEEPMALPVPQARRAVSVPLSLLPASASGTHAHLTPLQTEPLVTRPTIARSGTPTPPSSCASASCHAHSNAGTGGGAGGSGGRMGGLRSQPASPTVTTMGQGNGGNTPNAGNGSKKGWML